MRKIKKYKFDSLLTAYINENQNKLSLLLEEPFHGEKLKKVDDDSERVKKELVESLTKFGSSLVSDFYITISGHLDIFNSINYERELKKLNKQVIKKTTTTIKNTLEDIIIKPWVVSPSLQDIIMEESNLNFILTMTKIAMNDQIIKESPLIHAKLQNHFKSPDYKSLNTEIISLIFSVIAIAISFLALIMQINID